MLSLGKRQAMQLDDLTEESRWYHGHRYACIAWEYTENEIVLVLVASHAGHLVLIKAPAQVEEFNRR